MKHDMRNSVRRTATALATLFIIGAPISSVQAAEDKWKFEITPYLWTAGVDGDVTVNGHTTNVKISFKDMLDATNAAFSFLGVAQYGRVVLWGQVDYVSLDTDNIDNPPANARLEMDSTMSTLAMGYQFDGWANGQTVDVLIGRRQTGLGQQTNSEWSRHFPEKHGYRRYSAGRASQFPDFGALAVQPHAVVRQRRFQEDL